MAKIKFSAKAIDNLKPQEKVIEYFDTGQPGFGIRVQPTGSRKWFVIFRSPVDGKVKRTNIGPYPDFTLKEARHDARKLLGDISKGADPREQEVKEKKSDTFGGLFDDYMEHHARPNKRPASIREDQRIYDKYLQGWKDTKAGAITRKDIVALHRKISATAPIMANRVLSLISVVYSKALENELVEATPCVKIRKAMAREAPRERILSDDEIRALWAAFDKLRPNARDISKLVLLTAQRPGEIMSMRADELDLNQKTWTIPGTKTKNRQRHVVPLSRQVLKIIKPRITDDSPWIFPSNYNDNKSGHSTATNRARQKLQEITGINGWTHHDLRRTARTLMSRFGVRPDVAERVLNHAQGKMVRTYDQFDYLDEKRGALAKLANGIEKILAEKNNLKKNF